MLLNAAKIASEKLMIQGYRDKIIELNGGIQLYQQLTKDFSKELYYCKLSLDGEIKLRQAINASLIKKTNETERERNNAINLKNNIQVLSHVIEEQKQNCSIDILFAEKRTEQMEKNKADKVINTLKKQVEDLEKNAPGKTHNSIDLLNAEKNCLQTINQTKNQCELARILESNKTQSIVNRLNDEKKILEENATKCWEDMEKYKRFLDVVNRNHSYELNVTKVKGEKKMIRERNETALFAFELLYDTIKKLDENITNWENKLLECNSNLKIANMNNALFTEKETYYLAQAKNLTACQRQLIKVNDELEKC